MYEYMAQEASPGTEREIGQVYSNQFESDESWVANQT